MFVLYFGLRWLLRQGFMKPRLALTYYTAQDGLKLLILFPPPPTC